MKNNLIDYRGNTQGAIRDIRSRLKRAGVGYTFNIACSDDQIIRLLREITDYDAVIISRDTTDEGIFITIRKT